MSETEEVLSPGSVVCFTCNNRISIPTNVIPAAVVSKHVGHTMQVMFDEEQPRRFELRIRSPHELHFQEMRK